MLFESRGFVCYLFQPHARVAQWIRAFASGAKGRRFDPCRGYHVLSSNRIEAPVVHTYSIFIKNPQLEAGIVDDSSAFALTSLQIWKGIGPPDRNPHLNAERKTGCLTNSPLRTSPQCPPR